MRIVFISDTHGKHHELTEHLNNLVDIDVIVHSGDISMKGRPEEVENFLEWYDKLPFKHKIFISGNHDFMFDTKWVPRTENGKYRHTQQIYTDEFVYNMLSKYNVIYLNDSGITIDGINFWGSPVTLWFHDWAFNRYEDEIVEHWNLIPENTNILISHGPPFGKLDYVYYGQKNVGCHKLLEKIHGLKDLKVCCFGHIHEGYGHIINENFVNIVNASSLNLRYDFNNLPIIIEI
jgi:Icc-related predicted phosphoesterase